MNTPGSLEAFYGRWSDKDRDAIEFDVKAATRKAEAILAGLPRDAFVGIEYIVEVGCGYGGFIAALHQRLQLKSAIGFDFSSSAIDFAKARFGVMGVAFYASSTLNAEQTTALVRDNTGNRVDCIALIDVIEHVPDALAFVRELAAVCELFLIKLPVESSVFDNYCTPKEYPSSRHSNGHVREFDANSVYYFVRQLGLTPLYERLYVYDFADAFPPPPLGGSLKGRMFRLGVLAFKRIMAWLMPKKWFLRLVGGGGYYCLARFDEAHVLRP